MEITKNYWLDNDFCKKPFFDRVITQLRIAAQSCSRAAKLLIFGLINLVQQASAEWLTSATRSIIV